MLENHFFDRDTLLVARELLGKVIRMRCDNTWLAAMITETEAYRHDEKASHSSLGYTEKRRALFMPAGTIYMYYARGGDSMNISCKGEGNAVLIKSAKPFVDKKSPQGNIKVMQAMNLINGRQRDVEKLCAGQTIVCKSLGIKVPDWNAKEFDKKKLYIEDVNSTPSNIIATTRKGIPQGRDEHLPYRFVLA